MASNELAASGALSEVVAARRASGGRVILELGCGDSKRDDAIGVDNRALPGDVVADAYDALTGLSSASVDAITSSHFLEHLPDLD